MVSQSNNNERRSPSQDTFTPDQNRSLSTAVLQVIGEYKDIDLTDTDFTLYNNIDPTALNNLFRHDAQPNTTVAFSVDDVRVHLWGDGGVEIRVTDRPEDEPFPSEIE